jgi:hypothetical protein
MAKELMIPCSVNILNNWVKVIYVDHIKTHNKEHLYGTFDLEENCITIRITDNLEDMYRTFVHECSHAAIAYSGFCEVINARQEEGFCRLFENFTKLFSLRNSKSVRWKKATFL